MTAAQAAQLVRHGREQARPVRLVTGHFDPLLAAHAVRLGELAIEGGVLFVAVTEPAAAMLPAGARAELVAALRVVDYVVLAETSGYQGFHAGFAPGEVFHGEAADKALMLELIAHVHRRHQSS